MNVLILGANGQIAREATDLFLNTTDAVLTLYLRNASRLNHRASDRVHVVEGDVRDASALAAAVAGQDVVYANLDGDLVAQARSVVAAMQAAGVRRLVWVSSMGIYDEVPGQRYQRVLDPYRDSAAAVEASGLDVTILRPAWLNNRDEIDYATTRKGEPFANPGGVVSRKSVADLVVRVATTPGLHVGESLGVHKPA